MNKRYIKGIEVPEEIFNYIKDLEYQSIVYGEALSLIAALKRPDGTYNRSREACEVVAKEAFEKVLNILKKNVDNP